MCEASFAWMDNDEGQQPCLVAAYLIAPCLASPSSAIVLGLVQGLGIDAYTPPGPAGFYPASTCMCSSVTYSLLSACGICQGFTYDSWSTWIAQCPANMVSNGQYSDTIPSVVTIPQWAFLNITTGGGFNVASAQATANKNLPDVSASNVPQNTAGSGAKTTGNLGPTNTYSFPSYSVPTYSCTVPSVSVPTFSVPTGDGSSDSFHVNTKRKVNVGAIVGGIIGGISALISTMTGIWLWIKRRAKKAAASGTGAATAAPAPGPTPSLDPEKLQSQSPAAVSGRPEEYFPTTLEASPQPLRLYDPDDPSTYPDANPLSNLPTANVG